MKQALISVIIPVYNQEKFCGEAIDSVLDQSYKNFELIVINDGSTDSSLSIIREKCLGHNNIKIINQKNLGPSQAINAGLRIAKGEFIALCGGDDICTSDRLESQIEIISNSSADLVFSYPCIINQYGAILDNGEFPIFFKIPKDFKNQPFKSLFLHGNFLCAPSAIFKTSLLKDVGFFNPELIQLQDYDYWMRALGLGKKMILSEKQTVFYRRHTENLSSNKNNFLLNGEYQFLFSKILDQTLPTILRENFAEVLIPSYDLSPLSQYEKASILISSPLIQCKMAGLYKLLSLSEIEKNYLNENGVNLFTLILNTFKLIDESDEQQKEIASLKANLKQVLSSISWKITRPLRALKRLISGKVSITQTLSKMKK